MAARRRRAAARTPLWFALTLALALLFTQALGALHRVAHAELESAPHGDSHAHHPHAAQHGDDDQDEHAGGLFDAHEKASTACELFDQLTHSDTLVTLLLERAELIPAVFVQAGETPAARAATAAWFLARAPPQQG